MAAEAEVLDELRRLRSRVPQLTGALAASVDGLVLAHDTPGVEPEGVAALTAAALGVAVRMTDATAQGDFRELLVRGVYGYVATYAAGRSAVVTLLAQDRVNVGRLHLEGRRASARIGELVDAAAVRAEAAPPPPAGPPDKLPAKPPMRPTARSAAARTRTPRPPANAPRSTANARTAESATENTTENGTENTVRNTAEN
ncbi:roadblock/LC7 domain-containing protein [Streptomyces sp. NBC_00670]|jgi:predicted regulator of Ras-like GTPase activity (Roadblock/LC7/MglB family)|uniref:roadblock/LC7 domain-containing protein n=1 Tax=Streptomyces sp. NBC_00670 TaxID=2975804 RepID=UPI002E2FFFEB|nr:roadblock/LC7 domain-containing protein [Streptomyces sp. NBC_00670]